MKKVVIVSDQLFHDIHKYLEDLRTSYYNAPTAANLLARMGTGWSDDINVVKQQYGDETQRAEKIMDWPFIILRRS